MCIRDREVEILFRTLRQLSSEGTAILYISHKLEEIRSLCDEATILRRGKVVATCTPRERTAREMAELMVGTALKTPERRVAEKGEVALGAVSYTHLDVYKRQGLDCNCLRKNTNPRRRSRMTGMGNGGTGGRPELLKVGGITKAYPGVVANSDVSFAIGRCV